MSSTPAATGGGKRKTLLIAAFVLVAVLAGVGGFLLTGGSAEAEAAAPTEPPAEDGAVLDVAEMTANLAGPEVHYAKLSFAAVLIAGADEAAVAERFPLLRDAAITELSTFQVEHLRTTEGMEELRKRLTARAQAVYPDGEVRRVVLTELVVQ